MPFLSTNNGENSNFLVAWWNAHDDRVFVAVFPQWSQIVMMGKHTSFPPIEPSQSSTQRGPSSCPSNPTTRLASPQFDHHPSHGADLSICWIFTFLYWITMWPLEHHGSSLPFSWIIIDHPRPWIAFLNIGSSFSPFDLTLLCPSRDGSLLHKYPGAFPTLTLLWWCCHLENPV